MNLPSPETCEVLRHGHIYTVNVADLAKGETPYLPPPMDTTEDAPVGDPSAPPETGWAALTVSQLAQECAARSLKVAKGARKADLVALLEKAG